MTSPSLVSSRVTAWKKALVELIQWHARSLVVVQFNNGANAIQDVLEEMGCSVGEYNMITLELGDKMRTRRCEKKETLEQEKKQMRVRKRRRKGRGEQAVDEEGTTYEAGAFSTTGC